MARFATYTAPIERIHPNDLGYTANVQLGRRLAGFASETVGAIRSDTALRAQALRQAGALSESALRQGGELESRNILTARRADVALQRFIDEGLNPVQQAASRGSGGGGGGGGGSLGRDTAAPREVARAAPALVKALAQSAGDTGFNDSTAQRYRQRPAADVTYDPYFNQPIGMGGEGKSNAGQDIFLPAGYQTQYGPVNPADVYGPADPNAPASPGSFGDWYNRVTGAIGGAFSSIAAVPALSEGVDPDYTTGGF